MPSLLTQSESGETLVIALPDEDAVERLAFVLAISGCHPDDRGDPTAVRAKVTDAQRGLVRQFLVLSMNAEVA